MRAHTQIGVTEHPAGSNDGPEIRGYRNTVAPGLPPGPWCMYFVHWCFSPWVQLGGWGSVPNFLAWAQTKAPTVEIVTRPFKGDIVCFDWDANDWYDHVGIVDRVLALRWRGKTFTGWIRTVEGNTSPGVSGSQSNGGCVAVRKRWVNRTDKVKFVRVHGEAS